MQLNKEVCLRCVQKSCPTLSLAEVRELPELKDWEGGCETCPGDEPEPPLSHCPFLTEDVVSQCD